MFVRELVEPEKSVVLNSWKQYAKQDGGEKFVESIQILNDMVGPFTSVDCRFCSYLEGTRRQQGQRFFFFCVFWLVWHVLYARLPCGRNVCRVRSILTNSSCRWL